jgi:hypothetical protein
LSQQSDDRDERLFCTCCGCDDRPPVHLIDSEVFERERRVRLASVIAVLQQRDKLPDRTA